MIDALRSRLAAVGQRRALALCAVFLLALVLRLAMALWMPRAVAWEDGFRYMKVAQNLLSGQGFGSVWDNAASVPTQPLLLAALVGLFGKNFLLLRCSFALLGAATAVLGAVLARQLFGAAAGLLAGLLLALYPSLIYLGALFEYPQQLFIALMTGFFVLWFGYRQSGGWWRLAIAGLLLGAAVETVPTVLAFVPLMLACVVFVHGRRALVPALVLAITVALPISAWALRNYHAYGQAILVNKAAGSNFWAGNNENYYLYGKAGVVPACGPGFEFTDYCREWSAAASDVLHSNLSDLAAVNAYDRIGWERGIKWVRESPTRAAGFMARKFGLFWGQLPDAVDMTDSNVPPVRTALLTVSYFPMMALALLAVWWLRARFMELLPVYFYIVAMSAPYCIMMPVTRYRIPIDFVALLLAAYAAVRLLDAAGHGPATGKSARNQREAASQA